MGNLNNDLLVCAILGLSLYGYAVNNAFSIFEQKLENFKAEAKDTQFSQKMNINLENVKEIHKRLSEKRLPAYLKFLDPLKYHYLNKEYALLRNLSKSKLEEITCN